MNSLGFDTHTRVQGDLTFVEARLGSFPTALPWRSGRDQIRDSTGIHDATVADTGVSGGRRAVRSTGGVVLLTSSYSEAAFENDIGTYLSKKGWVS